MGWKDGCGYGPQQRPKERQSIGAIKEGSDRRKLFHREKRPALERNIIDTSERARTNYRYVIGQHLACEDIRVGTANLQLCAKIVNVYVFDRLSARSVAIGGLPRSPRAAKVHSMRSRRSPRATPAPFAGHTATGAPGALDRKSCRSRPFVCSPQELGPCRYCRRCSITFRQPGSRFNTPTPRRACSTSSCNPGFGRTKLQG
jgi:hypothetical protein